MVHRGNFKNTKNVDCNHEFRLKSIIYIYKLKINQFNATWFHESLLMYNVPVLGYTN